MSILKPGLEARRRSIATLLVLLAGLSVAGTAGAQNARVVTGSSTTGRILELDFTSGTAELLNTDAGARTRLLSVVYRDDGAAGVHLVAADDLAGKVLFYDDG